MGNVADNVLRGMGSLDTLDGGKGNDRLIGGEGNDTFGFATGYGKDEIVDFTAGDKVYVHNWKAIGDFNDLESRAANHGGDLWITAGHDTLVIDHMHKADLQAGDFMF
jgi:Ca2+-binding RTX toxin-like protein